MKEGMIRRKRRNKENKTRRKEGRKAGRSRRKEGTGAREERQGKEKTHLLCLLARFFSSSDRPDQERRRWQSLVLPTRVFLASRNSSEPAGAAVSKMSI
ncbi:hypothetical protein E2C01_068582 [Portunus trituberculatus]|uniref:Uncharacterized protein n=1 Tax=Portunus trituberculatus TaxID=210409 RepID=A0A5B7HZU7_PORTR|nr:hypothetical protein [Portunus trituberculatus]